MHRQARWIVERDKAPGSRYTRAVGTERDLALTFLQRLLDEEGPPPPIDWPRYRLMQLIPGTAGIADPKLRDTLVARGFAELEQGRFDAETEQRSIVSLRTLVTQILGVAPSVVPDYHNPLVAGLAGTPSPGTPPNLARLLTGVAEILRAAEAVTVIGREDPLGERMMTLLFIEGAYVGFLPASRALPQGGARA
jgi:hypothetical protein